MSPRWEEKSDVRRGAYVAYNLHAHLVFVTRYRREVFNEPMLERCEEIMRDVCAAFDAELKSFNGGGDHVHLLVHYPPKVALSKLVNSLKGVSSRYLRQEFTYQVNRNIMHGRFWSGSYFAGSVGGAPLAIVQRYIESQVRPGPQPEGRWGDSPAG
jgi:putative transposase